MQEIITISVAIIALCMIVIMMVVVVTLLSFRRLTDQAQKFVMTAQMHLPPVIRDFSLISADVRSIVRTMEREVPKLSHAFDSVRETAYDIQEFEHRLRTRLEHPALGVAALVGGARRGLHAVKRKLLG